MSQSPENQSSVVEHGLAENLVRTFWVAFNNAGLYGAKHPLASRTIDAFAEQLKIATDTSEAVTLYVEHPFLVCEEWRIGQKFYGERIVSRFKDAGIQSLTFYKGIGRTDAEGLVDALCAAKKLPTVEDMATGLEELGVKGFRFNYVTYQKVTADESIARQDLHRLAEILNVGNRIGDVADLAGKLIAAPAHIGQDSPTSLISRIRAFRETLAEQQSTEDEGFPPAEEIIEMLSSLRKSMVDELRMQALSGKIGSQREEIIGELDSLAIDVTMRIIAEEYRRGSVTPSRLATIIRRLVPERKKLRELLPRLKETLLSEGMSLDGYLELVKELADELASDDVAALLGNAAENLGVSDEEIASVVKKDPKSAVRLILLSAELQSIGSIDRAAFGNHLSEYIEKICSLARGTERDSGGQEEWISTLESGLVEHMAEHGLYPDVVDSLNDNARKRHARKVVISEPPSTETSVHADNDNTRAILRSEVLSGGVEDGGSFPREVLGKAALAMAASVVLSREDVSPDRVVEFLNRIDIDAMGKSSSSGMENGVDTITNALCEAGVSAERARSIAPNLWRLLRKQVSEIADSVDLSDVSSAETSDLLTALAGLFGSDPGKGAEQPGIDQSFAHLFGAAPAENDSKTNQGSGEELSSEETRKFLALAAELGNALGAAERSQGLEGTSPVNRLSLVAEVLGNSGIDIAEREHALYKVIPGIDQFMGEFRDAGLLGDIDTNAEIQNLDQPVAVGHEMPQVAPEEPTGESDTEDEGTESDSDNDDELVEEDEEQEKPARRGTSSRAKDVLPKEIVGPKETKLSIAKELSRLRRHGTSVSFIAVSIDDSSQADALDKRELVGSAAQVLLENVRDLDTVGYLGSVNNALLVLMLPMTDSEGLRTVQERVHDELVRYCRGETMESDAQAVLSSVSIEAMKKGDASSVVRKIRTNHRKNGEHILIRGNE